MFNRSRRAIERLYRDKATIWGTEEYKDGSITKVRRVIVEKLVPCKVSLRSQKAAERGVYAQIDYDAKLYLSPDISVPDGADISVVGIDGRLTNYVGGRSFPYPNHQEIYLKYSDKVR